ncbi:unnamed protein product [Polarella glacialis]|uniref:Uncharacterized protein n=1 Tax=Polarella glacialis TaxID=89957 RepID=A0A813IY40_POLGL|nr:unnamed protein product [Polarella glacialis]
MLFFMMYLLLLVVVVVVAVLVVLVVVLVGFVVLVILAKTTRAGGMPCSGRLAPWWLLSLSCLHLQPVAAGNYFGPYFKIDNAKADIRDLDVGDLDDWESDMPMPFLEHVKEEKEAKSRKKNSVNMQDFSKDPMAFAAMGGGASGSSMAFVTLTIEETEKIGKAGTEKLSSAWTSMLENGGIKVQAYAVDPGSVLFVALLQLL